MDDHKGETYSWQPPGTRRYSERLPDPPDDPPTGAWDFAVGGEPEPSANVAKPRGKAFTAEEILESVEREGGPSGEGTVGTDWWTLDGEVARDLSVILACRLLSGDLGLQGVKAGTHGAGSVCWTTVPSCKYTPHCSLHPLRQLALAALDHRKVEEGLARSLLDSAAENMTSSDRQVTEAWLRTWKCDWNHETDQFRGSDAIFLTQKPTTHAPIRLSFMVDLKSRAALAWYLVLNDAGGTQIIRSTPTEAAVYTLAKALAIGDLP